MKVRTSGHRAVGTVALTAALIAACHKDQATADAVDAALVVVAPVDAAPTTTVAPAVLVPDAASRATTLLDASLDGGVNANADADAGRQFPTTWSDPRVVAALAKSCSFDPTKLPEKEQTKRFGPHRPIEGAGDYGDDLGCTGDIFPQGCAPDPCVFGAEADSCRNACVKTCGTCSDACVSTCNDCEAACTDDACRLACAKKTASCRIGCQHARDTCGDKDCDAVIESCNRRLIKEFKDLGCSKACKPFQTCMDRCEGDGGDPSACTTRCAPAGKEKCVWDACGDPRFDPQ